MAVRLTVLNALAKLGYLPNHPDYDFHVKKHLIKEFKLEQKSSNSKVAACSTNKCYQVHNPEVTVLSKMQAKFNQDFTMNKS